MKVKVVQCPKCGFIQGITGKALKCKKCNKQTQLTLHGAVKVKVLAQAEDERIAQKIISQLKLKMQHNA